MGFAALFFAGALLNWLLDPTRMVPRTLRRCSSR
jgi:hypothetical protein